MILEFISENSGIPVSAINTDDWLDTDLGMDSLDIVVLSEEIEDHYDISIGFDEIIGKSLRVSDVVELVERLKNEKR